jgi:tyrosine-protein kinase Etk/Wzc
MHHTLPVCTKKLLRLITALPVSHLRCLRFEYCYSRPITIYWDFIFSVMNITLEDILRTSSSNPDENQIVKKAAQLLQNWPWLLLSIILCLLSALLYLRYTTPIYEISSTILVKDDTKGTDLGEAAIMENLGLSSGKSNVDNEVEILKSRMLMEKVVSDLQLFVTCFAKGNIKTTELYGQSPVQLRFISKPTLSNRQIPKIYTVSFQHPDSLTISDHDKTWKVSPQDTITLPEGRAVLTSTIKKPDNDDTYQITISGFDETVRKYSRALKVSATNKQVSIITIKLTDLIPAKGEYVLQQLIKNYLLVSQNDKNRIAEQTIRFIDDNLDTVSTELVSLEGQMERFRINHQVADLSEQSRLMLADLSRYEQQGTEIQTQLGMIKSMLKLIKSNALDAIPSSVMLQQPVFLSTVSKYNQIQLLREKALLGATAEHPSVQNLDQQMASIRRELLGHIEAREAELTISYNTNLRQATALKSQILDIPATERMFLDLQRQLQIKQELHTFLLKKRIETSISRSSTLPNGRIIDPPKADYRPVSPDRQITILLALLTGLFIPVVFLTIRDIFNIRLSSKQELLEKVKAPLIGEIGFHKGVRFQFDQSVTAEQLRTLRTNLQFVTTKQKNRVVLITSSVSEEGKTFMAVNLCHALHLSGKTTILLDFDLRRPQVGHTLQLRGKGITDYAISDVSLDSFIQNSDMHTKFPVITAGTIPPNPAELIGHPRIREAIAQLRQQYDYVIIDSPPFELVTDARLLSQYADLTLYVVRQNFTFRHQLDAIQRIYETGQLPKLHIILNNASRGASYGYAYGQK